MPVQVRASLWFLVCSFLQRGISVIVAPIFTRLLTPQEYGQYSYFNSWLDIISVFVTLRLYYGVFVQGLVKYEDDRNRYSSSMQGLELVLCLFWTAVYLAFREFWNNLLKLTTVQMLAMLVMIWAAGAFRFWLSEQRVLYKYKMVVILTLMASLLKPFLGILFVLNAEDKVTARILGITLTELIIYGTTFTVQMMRGKQFYSAKYWKHALLFNIPLIPHYLAQTVLNAADKIMIRDMVGAGAAGIYAIAYSISKIMILFNNALNHTLTPWYYQKIKAGRADIIASIAYPSLIGIAVINLILIAFAPEIIKFFAPKPYYDAIWIIPPIAMSVFFTFGYNLFACFEFYFEKTKFIMVASVFAAFLNVLLNYICIQRFGYYAAGYTTLICYAMYTLSHYYFMNKLCKIYLPNVKVYNKKVLASITCIFLSCGFLFLLSYNSIIMRCCLIVLFLLVLLMFRHSIHNFINKVIGVRKNKHAL